MNDQKWSVRSERRKSMMNSVSKQKEKKNIEKTNKNAGCVGVGEEWGGKIRK